MLNLMGNNCIEKRFSAVQPVLKDSAITCTPPISTQFCADECDYYRKGDKGAVKCHVDEYQCNNIMAEACEGACS
jgi:hypothetical protein